jgi:hypothetical protein
MSDVQKMEVFDNIVKYVKKRGGKVKYKTDFIFWRCMPEKLRKTGMTLGKTIWLPERGPRLITLIHETSHLVDAINTGVLRWMISYLMPQFIGIIWILFSTLAIIINIKLWPLIIIGIVLALLPLPSRQRITKEGRAYMVSLYFKKQFYGKISESYKNKRIDSLCSWLYYKMIWTRDGAKEAFRMIDNQSNHYESLCRKYPEVKDIEEIING